MKPPAKQKHVPQKGRENIFRLLSILLPFIILIVFEGILRMAGYGDKMNLFIPSPIEGYEEYMMVNPDVGKKYFQKFEYTSPANDIFLKKKPENTFRIFVMGSSVVYGFPYERNLMFSRILHEQLQDAYPGKHIEMVNTAITAINSFTLVDFSGQILKYDPDAVLIYAGHNEFYGAFGIGSNETMSRSRVLTKLHIRLLDLRIYQLLRNLISGAAKQFGSPGREDVHGTLMKRIAGAKDILLDSPEYSIAMKHYRENMEDILKRFREKEIPVFISQVVSNVRDLRPFGSRASGSLQAADSVFSKAMEAEKNEDFDRAGDLYYKAKDLDCIRFRASEEVNRIVGSLSQTYGANLVPMLSWFRDRSPHGLIGNNFMTEHVHPNIYGNILMAEAFFTSLSNLGLIGTRDTFVNTSYEYYIRNYGYTELDSLLALHRVRQLMGYWPFVKDESGSVDYRKYYKPVSRLDSISFSVLKDPSLSLDVVRLDLAKNYQQTGRIGKACREYEALLRMNPYIAVNYRDAATCLLQMQDLPRALKYFLRSLELEDSFFAQFRVGEIYLIMADYARAIKFFESAFKLAPAENKNNVAGKLYMAYVYSRKKEQAEALAAELRRVNAAGYLVIPPARYSFVDYVPGQTKDEVNRAKKLIEEEKVTEGLELLESSLNTYDSHIAARMAGELSFQLNDFGKANYYFSKVFDQFRFDPEFLGTFARLCYRRGDIDKGKKIVDMIAGLDPEYEELEALKDILK